MLFLDKFLIYDIKICKTLTALNIVHVACQIGLKFCGQGRILNSEVGLNRSL